MHFPHITINGWSFDIEIVEIPSHSVENAIESKSDANNRQTTNGTNVDDVDMRIEVIMI